MDQKLADVDNTKVAKRETLRDPPLPARIRIKNANYWEQFGGSI